MEDTLARALGPWPLSNLGVLVLVGVADWRCGLARSGSDDHAASAGCLAGRGWLDASGVMPSALMVVGVVALSFVKPMAFSRYFVVLLPAWIPCLAVLGARVPLYPRGQAIALMTMACWWRCGGSRPFWE